MLGVPPVLGVSEACRLSFAASVAQGQYSCEIRIHAGTPESPAEPSSVPLPCPGDLCFAQPCCENAVWRPIVAVRGRSGWRLVQK
jgi:hypothetical protein